MIAAPETSLETAALIYARSRDKKDREKLCEAALPMVRRIAMRVLRCLPYHFTKDDLMGDGWIGLLRAADRFDPDRGISFEVWATRIVRGSILNGLRRMDAVPERVRRNARMLESARWQLAQRDLVAPTDAVAADCAGLTRRKLDAVKLALRRAVPLSLDAPLTVYDHVTVTLGDKLPAETDDPVLAVSANHARAAVVKAVRALPPRERMIISTFYTGDTTFRVIGAQLGISKQRVSQIHGRAIASLRQMLAAQRDR